MPVLRNAEHPRPDHVLLHLSDTHLIAGEERLYGAVDADARLRELLERIESARIVPSALVVTGDLVDAGEPAACRKLRTLFGPFAERLGCEVVWVMGNHDDRAAMRRDLLAEPASREPLDRVHLVDGLRIVALRPGSSSRTRRGFPAVPAPWPPSAVPDREPAAGTRAALVP